MSEDEINYQIYEEEYLGKKPQKGKNPNFARFNGLVNLVKVLKHDLDIIKSGNSNMGFDNHVNQFKENQMKSFRTVMDYYEDQIQIVKTKLS